MKTVLCVLLAVYFVVLSYKFYCGNLWGSDDDQEDKEAK